jgi:hypothetical protein
MKPRKPSNAVERQNANASSVVCGGICAETTQSHEPMLEQRHSLAPNQGGVAADIQQEPMHPLLPYHRPGERFVVCKNVVKIIMNV